MVAAEGEVTGESGGTVLKMILIGALGVSELL